MEPKFKKFFRITNNNFSVEPYEFIGYKGKSTSPVYYSSCDNHVYILTDVQQNMIDMEGQNNFTTELNAFSHVGTLLRRELDIVNDIIKTLCTKPRNT